MMGGVEAVVSGYWLVVSERCTGNRKAGYGEAGRGLGGGTGEWSEGRHRYGPGAYLTD